jgi:hypothetical protein
MSPHLSAMGFGMLMGQRASARRPPVVEPIVGFTNPAIVFDKQKEIEAHAQDLGPKIVTYATDGDLIRAWQAFDARWTPFYQKYAGSPEDSPTRLALLTGSDEIAAQTNAFAKDLDALKARYETQHLPNGQPVPRPVGPDVQPIPQTSAGWTLPWWAWMLGGVAVVGAGYYLYRTYVGGYVRAYRGLKAASASDQLPSYQLRGSPAPVVSYPAGIPLSVQDVAHHPMPPVQQITYRPYEHPHVVQTRDRAPALDQYDDPDYDGDEEEY